MDLSNKHTNQINSKIILVLILALVLPFIVQIFQSSRYILKIAIFILIYSIATSGLDVLYGYCGQISMGHAGFFAIGAYGSAIITDALHVHPLLSIIISCILSVLVAAIISYPAANLKFHFLSLATVAFGEIIFAFIQASPNGITGNTRGYFPLNLFIFKINITKNYTLYYYLVLVILCILLSIKQNIVNSKIGRSFLAIKGSPIAASSMGINVRLYKVLAFCISAFYVAFAGGLYAHFVGYINPSSFSYDLSVLLMTMLLLGGSSSLWGPIIGVTSIQLLNEALRSLDKYQTLFYGVIILIVVLFMPNGIINLHLTKHQKQVNENETSNLE